jgi:hypothetical protein
MNEEVIEGVVNDFCIGVYDFRVEESLWHPVFTYILDKHQKLSFEKESIHTLWTVNGGHLRRKINDDLLISKVLSMSMPGYDGDGIELYRGECRFLYESNRIGFCWTPDIDVAKKFASGLNSLESGGVLLKAYAPPESIYTSPNSHSAEQMKEFEYTCNPFLLKDIEVLQVFEKR